MPSWSPQWTKIRLVMPRVEKYEMPTLNSRKTGATRLRSSRASRMPMTRATMGKIFNRSWLATFFTS